MGFKILRQFYFPRRFLISSEKVSIKLFRVALSCLSLRFTIVGLFLLFNYFEFFRLVFKQRIICLVCLIRECLWHFNHFLNFIFVNICHRLYRFSDIFVFLVFLKAIELLNYFVLSLFIESQFIKVLPFAQTIVLLHCFELVDISKIVIIFRVISYGLCKVITYWRFFKITLVFQ